MGGKNSATPLAFLLNFNVTSHFNYLFSSPNLFHCVPQRSKAFQVIHHLAGSKPSFWLVRYTGGTKNGVKRLSNDYQRYLSNKKAPVKSAILIDYNQFNYLIIKYLLADAKVLKYILQCFFRGYTSFCNNLT